jgi:hypothetical protein
MSDEFRFQFGGETKIDKVSKMKRMGEEWVLYV